MKYNVVTRPAHYNFATYEVLDVIEDWGLDFYSANVLKYIARAGKKSKKTEIQDLEKAAFYLQRKIKSLKKKKK